MGTSLAGPPADQENIQTVSIIHTTDLHGHITPTRTYDGVKNVGGFARCATQIRQWRREAPASLLIGLITPGLQYWLAPETLDGAEFAHPLDALRRSVAETRSNKADAIVVMGHMGFTKQDDHANPVREILDQVPGVDVYLGGHTHVNHPLWKQGNVLCSQAAFHGIFCGRVDLTFDRATRKLIGRNALTELMDARFELDAAVMDLAGPNLKTSADQLARKVAAVKAPIRAGGDDNPLAVLFCECFAEALAQNGHPVDGVFHGTFRSGDVPTGELTVGDCWKMLPYETLLVTGKLDARELIEIIKMECGIHDSDRILWPFQLRLDDGGAVTSFTHRGKPVAEDASFTIAFNCFDAQSANKSMMLLREILSRPEAKRRFTGIETLNALIDDLLRRKEIGA